MGDPPHSGSPGALQVYKGTVTMICKGQKGQGEAEVEVGGHPERRNKAGGREVCTWAPPVCSRLACGGCPCWADRGGMYAECDLDGKPVGRRDARPRREAGAAQGAGTGQGLLRLWDTPR